MRISKISQKTYSSWCNCADFKDGNDVQQIVRFDDLQYPEETYFHNPEFKITKEKFQKLTNYNYPTDDYVFFGYNPQERILFAYNYYTDRHDFFR